MKKIKEKFVPDGGIDGLNFVTTEKGNKFYKKWLLWQRHEINDRNPYSLKGLVIEDKHIEEFIYMYKNCLGGLCNCEVVYLNGVKLQ